MIKKFIQNFFNLSKKQNELPFEKIQVGPGLNKGFTGAPTGGFHDMNQRDYAMPKSTDQLRTANNPKLQYKGRVTSGKSDIDNRGMIGEVIKTTPDSFYINDGVERAFTTTGAYVKERQRPTILIKDTNRQCTSANEYTGVAEAMTTYGIIGIKVWINHADDSENTKESHKKINKNTASGK